MLRQAVLIGGLIAFTPPQGTGIRDAIGPGVQDIATVWIGMSDKGPDGFEYFRLEIQPDATGLLTRQFAGAKVAVAYKVTKVSVRTHMRSSPVSSIELHLEPADISASPASLSGVATFSFLTLTLEGASNGTVWFLKHRDVMAHLKAVTDRARAYHGSK